MPVGKKTTHHIDHSRLVSCLAWRQEEEARERRRGDGKRGGPGLTGTKVEAFIFL